MNNDLLSSQDFADVRDVLNDVMFTFFKRDIIYKLDSNTATRFMKDISSARNYTEIPLKGFIAWNGDETKQKETGAYDYDTGYCLLRYDDCLTNGIVVDKNLATTPPQDKLSFEGKDYYIDGMFFIGQWKDTDVMIKIIFRKEKTHE